MSDNTYCNFRKEKCSQERSQKFLKYEYLTIEMHRMSNVKKLIPIVMWKQEPYQNNSGNISTNSL